MTATLRVRPSERATSQPRPPIRVLPVPPLEPPTDEEWARAGAEPHLIRHDLAPTLPFPTTGTAPATAAERPTAERLTAAGRPAGAAGARTAPARGAGAGVARASSAVPATGAGRATEAGGRLAVHRFVGACVEVIGGYRPATQLRALCAPETYAEIAQALTMLAAHPDATTTGAPPSARTPVTGRTSATGTPTVTRTSASPRTPVTTRAATGAPPRAPRQGRSRRSAGRRSGGCTSGSRWSGWPRSWSCWSAVSAPGR
ncbi:Rv3235 family protein [Luedemannella flava]